MLPYATCLAMYGLRNSCACDYWPEDQTTLQWLCCVRVISGVLRMQVSVVFLKQLPQMQLCPRPPKADCPSCPVYGASI